MSKNYWNPNDYSLEDQLRDMCNGRDVVISDDGSVSKGTGNHVDVFYPSDSERGHGHTAFDYDEDTGRWSGRFIHK